MGAVLHKIGEPMKEITDANFRKEILASTRPIMLLFTAAFCAPYKTLTPISKISGKKGVTS